jgi:predicted SAM-dependent methyltransferase
MKSQRLKDLYYASIGKLSILSFCWHRMIPITKLQSGFLNIGCGAKYIDGMINIDGNIFCKKDIWLDVTLGLPFPANSIQGIYASHVVEHLGVDRVRRLFSEFYRVLNHSGVVRVVVPSLEYAIGAYQENRTAQLPEWPDSYNSPGGRFNNFMLCRNQHLTMFDFSFLEELLRAAGFSKVFLESPNRSQYFGMDHMRFESDPTIAQNSLFVESVKE